MRCHVPTALTTLQIAAACAGLPIMALWPPATGRMTIVAIDGSDANRVFTAAVNAHARVVGSGPLPRSLVVVGDRAEIATRLAPWSVLFLAPGASGCGLRITPGAAA